ncbi:ATP-binding protein [Bacteroidota bacterium]
MTEDTIKIESKYKNVDSVINKVQQFAFENGVNKKQTGEIVICVVEALNNIIKHGYLEKPGSFINIGFQKKDDIIKIQITDKGISRKNFTEPSFDFDPDDIQNIPEGGMGLYLIETLMDNNMYETIGDKNLFTMEKIVDS